MKYAAAFEVAEFALRDMQKRGMRFRDGVLREAALAAVAAPYEPWMQRPIALAMTRVFEAFRIDPGWDGSIA